jgi:hypothetical protein
LFLYPGIALLLIGTTIDIWLLPGPRIVGKVAFDYNTLLFGAMAILIGFQSVNFAVFSKVFAIAERLLPKDPRLDKVFHYLTLEVGLMVGALLILAGCGTWIFGLSYWHGHNFGHLDPDTTLRIIVPGLVFLTLGVEIVLSSFFISVLGMGRR